MDERDAENQENFDISDIPPLIPGDDDDGSDWETILEDDNDEPAVLTGSMASPFSSQITTSWHEKVMEAVQNQSLPALEELLQAASSSRREIQDFAEDIVVTVGDCIAGSSYSVEFEANLEMLMYVVVEYGNPAELVMCFMEIFDKRRHPAEEVRFFIPNMQGTLLRLEKFRLFWLSSILAQIDYFVADFDWHGLDQDDGDYNEHRFVDLQSILCDFVQPFVEDVSIEKSTFDHVPMDKNFLPDVALAKYRECLARSLLHILAHPLGTFPISFAEGFASYRRIVRLLGKVVGDFTVFSRWLDRDEAEGKSGKSLYEEGADELMRIPVNPDSISKLAFLVKCCDVEPDRYPSPLSSLFFLNELFVPYSDGGQGENSFREHTTFLSHLLEQIPDEGLLLEDLSREVVENVLRGLLMQASMLPDESVRKKIYRTVQLAFSKMDKNALHYSVSFLWNHDDVREHPNIREVLVMAVKRPVAGQLARPDWIPESSRFFSRRQLLDLLKLMVVLRPNGQLDEQSGLIACVAGVFSVALGMDGSNRSGILDLWHAVKSFLDCWRKAVEEDSRQIREDVWTAKEEERVRLKSAGLVQDGLAVTTPDETVQMVEEKVTHGCVISMALDSLHGQLSRSHALLKDGAPP